MNITFNAIDYRTIVWDASSGEATWGHGSLGPRSKHAMTIYYFICYKGRLNIIKLCKAMLLGLFVLLHMPMFGP